MLSCNWLMFQPERVPAAKLRAEWTDSAFGGRAKVALVVVDPGSRRSRAGSGHQPIGGHQSSPDH
ncbi:hypothetical protein Psi02_04200 [Planotetraspora silvatica]|uniref:Uncharacterized protein n=1 Tax=Planotetraspora silvatica TaxID=234614 RepID=A0A8J3UIN1_9ACTN|nr:hypothetical protein Psi02_04200 [Planotetraspora silvatica]